jgi:hypothetical protein
MNVWLMVWTVLLVIEVFMFIASKDYTHILKAVGCLAFCLAHIEGAAV